MAVLLGLSDWIIPIIMIAIIVYGLLKKVSVFEAFVEGASDGFKIVLDIMPTLIGLLVAVGMLRCSGALDGLTRLLTPLISWSHFPPQLVPIILMRSVSSSAATGLLVDLFKTYGPDAFVSRTACIIFGCTETIFYTMSVYFMTIRVKNSRYTLAGAVLTTLSGVIVAYYLTLLFFGI